MRSQEILLVEDESIIARDLQSRVERLGYSVCGIASTANEAIAKAKELNPMLVLMDIGLKGPLDGVAAAAEILRQTDTRIVFLSAYSDGQTLERAKLLNPAGYLGKPLEERELSSTLEEIIGARRNNENNWEPRESQDVSGDHTT